MSFSFREERRRKKRRAKFFAYSAAIVGIFGLFALVYSMGLSHGQVDLTRSVARIDELTTQEAQLQQARAAAESVRDKAVAELESLRQRYVRDVPTGAMREIMELVAGRLAGGVEPERLKQVLTLIQDQRSCDQPVAKRFIARTPIDRTSANSVQFADNQITVAGDGIPARDRDGNPEGWFDPAQPVTVRFSVAGGRSQEVSGKLPISQSVVFGGWEHRFTLTAGARGFVSVSADRCSYP